MTAVAAMAGIKNIQEQDKRDHAAGGMKYQALSLKYQHKGKYLPAYLNSERDVIMNLTRMNLSLYCFLRSATDEI